MEYRRGAEKQFFIKINFSRPLIDVITRILKERLGILEFCRQIFIHVHNSMMFAAIDLTLVKFRFRSSPVVRASWFSPHRHHFERKEHLSGRKASLEFR